MNYHGYLLLQQDGPRATDAVRPLLRPVERSAGDALRGHVRARRRRRRHAAHPPLDRRPGRRPPAPLDARAPRPRAVRRRAAARRDLGRHDPAVLRRHVRARRRAVHAAQPLGRRRRRRRPPSPARAIAWWRLEQRLAGNDTHVARRARTALAAWPACSASLVNGTHPLLPWLAFFCAGIVARPRASGAPGGGRWPSAVGAALFVLATLDRVGRRAATAGALLSTDPWSREPRVHGERARHRAGGVRRHHVARRALPRVAARRLARAPPAR